jgi:preprotein translocase subunit SecD
LSLLQATLTLPGIAGIVLTVGMAVDANVLIFERIREEIRNANSPQSSIHAGYEKAFSTIADANITTLIAAMVLFSFGTGPIKGFAVTLSLGIICSMFTAIMVTRALVNLTYGGRKLDKLRI